MTSIEALLSDAANRLSSAGIVSARSDAEWLLAEVLEVSRGELAVLAVKGEECDESLVMAFRNLLSRREAREPLQHIVGRAPFLDFDVRVGPGVFIPRPETEVLAERVCAHAQSLGVAEAGLHVVDLCSGSGVLAVALARAVPYARVTAVETSEDAIDYLRSNVTQLAPAIEVHHGDAVAWAREMEPSSVDVIVANPPYIPTAEVPNDPEVAMFDPSLALYAGTDGLDVIRAITQVAQRLLRPGGLLAMEHSNLQGAAVRDTLQAAGFRTVETYRDLTDRDRFTSGYQP